jgi:hypothetical protein
LKKDALADFYLQTSYQASTNCTGSVYSLYAAYGDLGYGGCRYATPTQWTQLECVNSTSAILAYYSTADCAPGSRISVYPYNLPFGCQTSGGFTSSSGTCMFGTYYPSYNSYTQTTYNSINCSSLAGNQPSSIQEIKLDACLVSSLASAKFTYDPTSGNISSNTFFSNLECSGNPSYSSIVNTVGCSSSGSNTVLVNVTGAVPSASPSVRPSPSNTPSPSSSPSTPPVIQQTYIQTYLYNDATCTGTIFSARVSGIQTFYASGSTSQLRVCSSDGKSQITYFYSTIDCSGQPISSSNFTLPVCSVTGGSPQQYSTSTCQIGQVVAPANSFLSESFSSSSSCAFNGGKDVSYTSYLTDTCLIQGSQSIKITCSSTNANQSIYSSTDCSGSPTTSTSPPFGACLPGSSGSSSILSCSQQTFTQYDRYNDASCSGPKTTSYMTDFKQGCVVVGSNSQRRECSSDGLSVKINSYAAIDCSGIPISNTIPLSTCNPVSGTGSQEYTSGRCRSGLFQAPANALIYESYSYSTTCAFNLGVNVSYNVYPLDSCLVQGAGSAKYTCTGSTSSYSSYTSQDCTGTPTTYSGPPLGVCTPGSPSGSSYAYCSSPSSPSPSVSPSPTPSPSLSPGASASITPTPSLSTGASPSTTPSFRPSTTPINPRITNKYTLISGCGFVSRQVVAASGSYVYACFFSNAKLSPIMSILVYNSLGGIVGIEQKGFPKGSVSLTDAFVINTTTGLNAVLSTDLWISLGNITCTTSDNPSGICALSFASTTDITIWLSVYRYDEVTASNDAKSNPAIIGIAAGGGFVFILLLCGALHALRILKIPCFNVCCDRRPVNQKSITSYPVTVAIGGPNVVQPVQPITLTKV